MIGIGFLRVTQNIRFLLFQVFLSVSQFKFQTWVQKLIFMYYYKYIVNISVFYVKGELTSICCIYLCSITE